jgi:vacuolar-type H+-ATPase subunit I/STV1
MDIVFEFLATVPVGTTTLLLALISGAFFFIMYVIPKLRQLEELEAEKQEWSTKLSEYREALDKASKTIQLHVENSKTEYQIAEVLKTCQMTYNILVEYIRTADLDARKLIDEIDSVTDMLKDLQRSSMSDPAQAKLMTIDAELRVLGQQVNGIVSKLSSITGLLIGSGPNARAAGELMGVGEVKDLK